MDIYNNKADAYRFGGGALLMAGMMWLMVAGAGEWSPVRSLLFLFLCSVHLIFGAVYLRRGMRLAESQRNDRRTGIR